MSGLRLYELTNAHGECTSPFVWRVRFVLDRKRLAYQPVPVGFREIGRVIDGAFRTVPILEEEDGSRLGDSWPIVERLDAIAPDAPLFSSSRERAMVRFFDRWFGIAVVPPMFRAVVLPIWRRLKAEDQAYFRESREKWLGATLEAVDARADAAVAALRDALLPMRLTLRQARYLGGDAPNYADHIAWGCFAAFLPMAAQPLIAEDDPLRSWLDDGLRRAAALPHAVLPPS